MKQFDGERVVAQVAIAIWLRRKMQYREPVKLIVRSSCGVTERSASVSGASYFKSRTEYEQNQERERESRILVCQESSIKCAEGVRIEEAGQQVAKSLT